MTVTQLKFVSVNSHASHVKQCPFELFKRW